MVSKDWNSDWDDSTAALPPHAPGMGWRAGGEFHRQKSSFKSTETRESLINYSTATMRELCEGNHDYTRSFPLDSSRNHCSKAISSMYIPIN